MSYIQIENLPAYSEMREFFKDFIKEWRETNKALNRVAASIEALGESGKV